MLAVGPSRLMLATYGYDVTMAQAAMRYAYLGDLRSIYRPGQEINAKVLDITEDILLLSVRDAEPEPYQHAEKRYPVGASRVGVITNKYRGGVFCRLADGCTVVCKYAQQFSGDPFGIGEKVLVQIRSSDGERHWLRGKIRAKVG